MPDGRADLRLEGAIYGTVFVMSVVVGLSAVDGLAAWQFEGGTAVLRQAPFRDVEVSHDLEAAENARLKEDGSDRTFTKGGNASTGCYNPATLGKEPACSARFSSPIAARSPSV